MRSFIFSFRPLWLAASIVCLIELAVFGLFDAGAMYGNNFFELAYYGKDVEQKINTALKLHVLQSLPNVEFIQVGDSSGNFGPETAILEKYVGSGRYMNMSCCADMGYEGHRYMAEISARAAPSASTIVFYITPMAPPIGFADGPGLASSLYDSFLGPWSYLNPPSLAHRLEVTNFVYYGQFKHDISVNPQNLDAASVRNRLAYYMSTRGWSPHTFKPGEVPVGSCNLYPDLNPDSEGRPKLQAVYPNLAALARYVHDRHLRLMVVFQPVPCKPREDEPTLQFEREFSRFRADYPDVIIPFDVFTTWPARLFKDEWHTNAEGSQKLAYRLGPILQRVEADRSYLGIALPSVAMLDTKLQAIRDRVIVYDNVKYWTNAASWLAFNLRIESLSAATPTGDATAVRVSEDGENSWHDIPSMADLSKGVTSKFSAEFKSNGSQRHALMSMLSDNDRLDCELDFKTGKVSAHNFGRAAAAKCTAIAESGGWRRIELTGILSPGDGIEPTHLTIATTRESFEEFYQGDGRSGLDVGAISVAQERGD